jgi:poly(beta-D-mannuronate) lyase
MQRCIFITACLISQLTFAGANEILPPLRFPINIGLQQQKFAINFGSFGCGPTFKIPTKIERVSYYIDPPVFSKIDPERLAQALSSEKPIRDAENALSNSVTEFTRSSLDDRKQAAARCIVTHLLSFAETNAFLASNDVGGSGLVQLFSVTPLFAYGVVKEEHIANSDRTKIEDWITQLAGKLIEWQKDYPRKNNIAYWGAAALALAGVDLNDRRLVANAIEVAYEAIEEIDHQGLLPREMERGSRSLEYNLFAVQALSLIELVATENMISRPSMRSGLLRLMHRMIRSIQDPASFVQISKNPASVAPERVYGQNLGWLEIYRHITNDASVDHIICQYRPLGSSRTGGDWFFLMGNPSQCPQ